jgi:hypothetical protein
MQLKVHHDSAASTLHSWPRTNLHLNFNSLETDGVSARMRSKRLPDFPILIRYHILSFHVRIEPKVESFQKESRPRDLSYRQQATFCPNTFLSNIAKSLAKVVDHFQPECLY